MNTLRLLQELKRRDKRGKTAASSTFLQSMQKSDLKDRMKRHPALSRDDNGTSRAAEMEDRFHRMAMRTLRALRDVRQYSPAVTIRTAGQVNISDKQLNVASGSRCSSGLDG